MPEVLICSNHPEYHVPLIMTLKFMGAEFWCPYCGDTYGFFGNYIEVVEDKELKERAKAFKKASKEFLSGDNTTFQYKQKL